MNIKSVKILSILLLISSPVFLGSEPQKKKFAVLHTNDIQSRLLGYGPNPEYSPNVTNNDTTYGGFARLTTKIKQRRSALEKEGYAVLVLDGGDITMGTLFHTVAQDTGGELRLMGYAGYDAAAIGNHEFDFAAKGLSKMIRSAQKHGGYLPQFLLANIKTSTTDKRDDELEKLFKEEVIVPYRVIEKKGIRFGIFGLLGYSAWEATARKEPLEHLDPIETAKKMVKILKEKEKVDVIILCSHGGVHETENEVFTGSGEDVDYALKVPEIDIVIGGHSHTPIPKPKLVNEQTPILQAGSEARYLGELQMTLASAKRPSFLSYKLHDIDDSIAGDIGATKIINGLKKIINQRLIKKYGFRFDTKMAEISIDLTRKLTDNILGNMMADSIRTQSSADVGITTQGTIRDNLYKGEHGVQWFSDLFRLAPLGEGEFNNESGYPLAMLYITANELKSMLEVLTFGYRTKGLSYYPRFSGIRFEYNSWRVPLDTIYKIEMLNEKGAYEEIDFSKSNKKLYSVASSIYIARYFPLIKKLSKGVFVVIPKHKDGSPIKDMKNTVIDGDPKKAGIQEIKEWLAVIRHIKGFKDVNNNGISDIPTTGRIAETRMVKKAGIFNLFTNASFTYIYLILLALIGGIVYWRRHKA